MSNRQTPVFYDRKIIRDGRIRRDTNLIAKSLHTAFTDNGTHNVFLDISLVSNDDKSIRSNKSILAARSIFFRKIFCPEDGPATRKSVVHLPFPLATISEILQYIYTAETDLLNEYARLTDNDFIEQDLPSKFRDSTDDPDIVESKLPELISLTDAADHLDLHDLQIICCSLLFRVFGTEHECLVLEAAFQYRNGALSMLDPLHLWEIMAKDQSLGFDVPDVNDDVEDAVIEHVSKQPSIRHLSGDTLNFILQHQDGLHSEDVAQLFQALYVWATKGKLLLPKGASREHKTFNKMHGAFVSTMEWGGENDEEKRWKQARALVAQLDLQSLDCDFLRELVERSKLVDKREIKSLLSSRSSNEGLE